LFHLFQCPRRPPVVAFVLLAAAMAPLGGCSVPQGLFSFPSQVRGNLVDQEQIAELVPGTSTKQDAMALLGTATAKGAFDDSVWLYIGQVTKPVIGGFQGIQDQRVFELTFDQKGVLTSVRKRTDADSLPVDVVSRTTPSPGTDASFMQQLLGNVGKFSAGSNQASPGGAGAIGGGF